MALVFVGPRSIDGAVSYVRMSDVFTADRKRILEPVQALEHDPEKACPRTRSAGGNRFSEKIMLHAT
jgi:hypothetical protein